MSRSVLIAILLGLSLIGLVDSLYLAEKATINEPLFCDIGAGLDGCNIVAQSPYSQLAGIPLAYFGVAFFTLILLSALLVALRQARVSYQILMIVAIIGALFSLGFLYIQAVLIQALCIYCIISAFVAFFSLFVAWQLFSRFAPLQELKSTPATPPVIP